ncbi:conserved hypothetical protein [delta proteobacterium NaphS2]|nr:conserved hypothetical protein [delta proteobacterium NaphS2]
MRFSDYFLPAAFHDLSKWTGPQAVLLLMWLVAKWSMGITEI